MGELRVVRHTDHFEEGCRFYGDLLGWTVTKAWDEPSPGRIFGYGDSARVELLPLDGAPPVAGVYLAVEVNDVVAVHATILAAGMSATQHMADQPWGHRNFGIVDPTGLTIVFFEVIE